MYDINTYCPERRRADKYGVSDSGAYFVMLEIEDKKKEEEDQNEKKYKYWLAGGNHFRLPGEALTALPRS